MSSLTDITKTKGFPDYAYLAHSDEPEPEEEKPAEAQRATWKPEDYTPTRKSWHTTQGRVKRCLA